MCASQSMIWERKRWAGPLVGTADMIVLWVRAQKAQRRRTHTSVHACKNVSRPTQRSDAGKVTSWRSYSSDRESTAVGSEEGLAGF